MFKLACSIVASASALQLDVSAAGHMTAFLFDAENLPATPSKVEDAFLSVWNQLMSDFDEKIHEKIADQTIQNGMSFLDTSAYVAAPGSPKCDLGAHRNPQVVNGASIAPFAGGITKRVGFSLAGLLSKLGASASGPAAVSSAVAPILSAQALQLGAGTVQALVSSAIHAIPPKAIGTPLTCVPLTQGNNCAGAVLHPITAADAAIATTTDAALDGVVANFPAMYKRKVGSTSDAAYKSCFSSYMGMHCASSFPRCMAPQSGNDMSTASAQRLPLCFSHCVATLVACPGLWIEDIADVCQDVSVPPACSMGFFWNFDLLPPQYASFESNNAPKDCPKPDFGGFDLGKAATLYSGGAKAAPAF